MVYEVFFSIWAVIKASKTLRSKRKHYTIKKNISKFSAAPSVSRILSPSLKRNCPS